MIYRSYQHVERLGTTETNGILDGMWNILKKFKPKIRTNLQVKAVMPEIF